MSARLPDGTVLAARVWLPASGAPAPTLLLHHPYRNDYVDGLLLDHAHAFFAAHGYAAAMVDFRGLGDSGGTFVGEYGSGEGRDGAALVDWAARQRWCDGNVGMWGMSWPGMTALRAAAEAPGALKAVAALMAPVDVFGELLHPGGCHGCLIEPLTAANVLALQMLPSLEVQTGDGWLRTWLSRQRMLEPFGLTRRGQSVSRTGAVGVDDIAIPTLLVGGWRDIAVHGTLDALRRVRGERRAIIGPWPHVYPDAAQVEPVDHLWELLRWWDRWLKPAQPGCKDEPSVTYFCQGRGMWRSAHRWPPEAEPRTLWLARGHVMAERADEGSESVVHRTDPTVGVAAMRWLLDAVPIDQSDDDARSLCFTSPPCNDWLEIAGAARVRLNVEMDHGDQLQLVVRLCDVSPAGQSRLITVGQCAHGRSTSAQRVDIELAPTAYALAPGHRLRLAIGCGEFPFVWPTATSPTIRVHYGGDRLSAVEIPVLAHASVAPTGTSLPAPPRRARSPALLDDRSSIVVERELETARVSVASSSSTRLLGRDGRTLIDVEAICAAAVEAADPSGAVADATIRIRSSTPAGTPFELESHAHMTRTHALLRGQVDLGRVRAIDRSWTSDAITR